MSRKPPDDSEFVKQQWTGYYNGLVCQRVAFLSMEAYVCGGEIEAIFHRNTQADGFVKLSRAYCPDELTRQEWIQKLKEQINEYGHWFTIEDVRRQNMLAARQEPTFMRLK